ncbi:MAG TPA: hypothetical protein VE619_09095 [Nitrososphaeraceae archaeon]|nr:hypothetical protein [Nitrososphaeraceae archaeon]
MMNKKQIYSTVLSCIAISAILVASSLIAGIQFTQPALAQTAAAPPTPPPPSASTKKTAAAAGEPPLGKQVNWQGTVSSLPDLTAARGRGQVAVILPPRKDGGLYTGVITYTASKPVSVEVWNQLNGVSSTTLIPRAFGAISLSPSPTGKSYALALVGPVGASGSIPFTGNGVALRSASSPFIATYSLTATTSMATVKNNLTSASTAATLGSALGGASLGGARGSAGGATLGGAGSALGGASLGGGRGSAGGASLGAGGP